LTLCALIGVRFERRNIRAAAATSRRKTRATPKAPETKSASVQHSAPTIPAADYIPLVALLSRRLSSDEVRHVARQLSVTGEQPIDNVDIGTVITKVTNEMPREEDVARVRSRLALAGWPLAGPNTPA
jgi:hypothetical protein